MRYITTLVFAYALLISVAELSAQESSGFGKIVRTDTSGVNYRSISSDVYGNTYLCSGNLLICIDSTDHEVFEKNLGSGIPMSPQVATADQGTNAIVEYVRADKLFILKLDHAGSVIWTDSFPVPQRFVPGTFGGLSVSAYGDIYLAGIFTDTLSMGGHTVMSNRHEKPGQNPLDCLFIVKISASGKVQWLKRAGRISGLGGNQDLYDLATDNEGSAIITGSITGRCAFGDTIIALADNVSNLFLAKYDTSGVCRWVVTAGARPGKAQGIYEKFGSMSVAIDGDNNVIASGGGPDTCYIGPFVTHNASGQSSFVSKISPEGSVRWVKDMNVGMVRIDHCNNILVLGRYAASPIINECSISPSREVSLYIAKISPTGSCLWSKGMGDVTGLRRESFIHLPIWNPTEILFSYGIIERGHKKTFLSIMGNDGDCKNQNKKQ